MTSNYSRRFTVEKWNDWLGHFESVARINSWDENTYLLWLEVRLIRKAHNAWRQLSDKAKAQYSTAKAALQKCFKLESCHEVYMVIQARGLLANKVFPDLQNNAREQFSLD